MLKLIIYNYEKEQFTDTNILSVTINKDENIVASDITIECCYNEKYNNARKIYFYNNDALIFCGQVDEVKHCIDKNGAVSKIIARDMTGLLLDNEAEPVTYINPTADFIFEKHIKILGFTKFVADNTPLYKTFKIEKGTTNYGVLEHFCKEKYGTTPVVLLDGTVVFNSYNSTKNLNFSNNSKVEGVKYISIIENRKPCKIISEVRLKFCYERGYSSKIINDAKYSKNLTRVRFVDVKNNNSTLETADNIIKNGNKAFYSAVLECFGCNCNLLGCNATIEDKTLGKIENLRVVSLKYLCNNNAEKTIVKVQKEV